MLILIVITKVMTKTATTSNRKLVHPTVPTEIVSQMLESDQTSKTIRENDSMICRYRTRCMGLRGNMQQK